MPWSGPQCGPLGPFASRKIAPLSRLPLGLPASAQCALRSTMQSTKRESDCLSREALLIGSYSFRFVSFVGNLQWVADGENGLHM